MRAAALTTILITLLLPSLGAAEELPTAADVTERGRSLATALDRTLAPRKPEEGRVLWLLLDPTPSLATAGFADELAEALDRNAAKLAGTSIGVFRAGSNGSPELAPTEDTAAVAAAVRAVTKETSGDFRDIYADVRRLCGAFAGTTGSREILLVSLENGDAEDELPGTVARLTRNDIRLSAIAREAFFADAYWVLRSSQAPRGFEMAGSESAFVEVPWGFLFQYGTALEEVPAGFAMFGITRMAAASGGLVFLYYPPSAPDTSCSRYGGCILCSGDHIDCHESYQGHRLRALAPLVTSRAEVFARAARDPYLRAVLDAWNRASKEGIVTSRPSVRIAGGGLRPESRQTGRGLSLGSSLSFPGQAARAEQAARDCEEILSDLEAAIARADEEKGFPRYRVTAELTRVLLAVTRVNLLAFAAFCREAAPALLERARNSDAPEPPEVARYPAGYRITGIGHSTMPLCHGVEPYFDIHLPGGEELDRELAALAPIVEGFLSRHAHTPYSEAVRRFGLARFWLSGVGKSTPPPPRTPSGSESKSTDTESKERPARGGGSGGGSGGPASGGGR